MEFRKLGKSGLPVSQLSFGSWLTFGKQIGDNTAENLMRAAYEGGINFFDNAEIYSEGASEIVMGNILTKLGWDRTSYILSSKVYWGGKLPTQIGLHRKHVIEACEAALRRLQTDYLDLFFCHRPDKSTPIAETVWTMHQLIMSGKIMYWGTSEWSAQEIMEAHAVADRYSLIAPVMEQPEYNLLHRNKVEVEYAQIYKTVGLGTTIWSPLSSGLLTEKYLNEFPEGTRLGMKGVEWIRDRNLTPERIEIARKLNTFAHELGTTLPKLSIAWCLHNPNVSTVILGASRAEQLIENLTAPDALALLTPEVIERIEAIVQNKPAHPAY